MIVNINSSVEYLKIISLLAILSGCAADPSSSADASSSEVSEESIINNIKLARKSALDSAQPGTIPQSMLIGRETYREQFMNDPAARAGNDRFISMKYSADNGNAYAFNSETVRYGDFLRFKDDGFILMYGGFFTLGGDLERTEYEFKVGFDGGGGFDSGAPQKVTIYESENIIYDNIAQGVSKRLNVCIREKEVIANKYISDLPGRIHIYNCALSFMDSGSSSYGGETKLKLAYSDYLNNLIPSEYILGRQELPIVKYVSGSNDVRAKNTELEIIFIDESGVTRTSTAKIQ